MIRSILDSAVVGTIANAQAAARMQRTRTVTVDGQPVVFRTPFPSPTDWRQCWIYFLMIDRFNNPDRPPAGVWNRRFGARQGGTFKGVQAQLGYLQRLGVKAIWITPVLKNSRPEHFQFNYHGYGAQDFLNLDARFASDGTLATAELELTELVDEAHGRGIYVILDIVLNHSARVFDYVRSGGVTDKFADANVLNGPLGSEPPIRWLTGFGFSRSDWENRLDPPDQLHADDAVWPADLQDHLFFRRRGRKLSDTPDERGFVRGDFEELRQLVVEYDADAPGQEALREQRGRFPVLNLLIRSYAYLIARYDFDGFRIDTVKYVDPELIETFGNAIREFALSMGKQNFFTFGEVADVEATIASFIGRNGTGEGFGVDAALDFPLFSDLAWAAKGSSDVATIRTVFDNRKALESELLSSHGEAGRFFVSFLDNHDQKERLRHPQTPPEQVTLALALLFTLQGIPCLYYGTEQGLSGTVDAAGNPDLEAFESVREALWGKPGGFATHAELFRHIQDLSELRHLEPPLSYGRLYFREVSGNGADFGHSSGPGGIVAFSRILSDREILVAANTGEQRFQGSVIVDRDLTAGPRRLKVAYSNLRAEGSGTVSRMPAARFHEKGQVSVGPAAALPVILAPREVQVLVPA